MKPSRARKTAHQPAIRPDAPFSHPPVPRRGKSLLLWPLLLSALFLYLALSSVAMDSATDDEPAHIVAGYIKLKHGYFDFYPEQPPLINSLSALPLLFEKLNLPPVWKGVKDHWFVGHTFLYEAGNDADRILFLARLPIILLFLFLCWLAYAWVWHLTSHRGLALLALFLTGLCPNLLAHGRLATVDLGVTFFIALATYGFLRFLYQPTWERSVLTGVALAATMLSKISGLIVLPFFVLIFFLYLILEKKLQWKYWLAYSAKGLLILLSAFATMEMVFLWEMSDAYLQTAYPELASNGVGKYLIPLQAYRESVEAILHWMTEPYNKPQFFLGSFSFTGWWHFYLVAFLLKTPIGVLLLFLFALFMLGRMFLQRQSLSAEERKGLVHGMSLLLFIVLFLLLSSTSKINLGIRYVLPIYPFIYVLIPLTLLYAFTRFALFRRQGSLMVLGGLILWSVLSSLWNYPGYLSYFNEFIGDRRNADRYLIDSDLDWGQDLRRLTKWVDEQGIDKIRVGYVGGGNTQHYLREKVVPWEMMSPKEKGYYAISRHYYRISTFYKESLVDFEEFFEGTRYVTTVGGSIYVYYVG